MRRFATRYILYAVNMGCMEGDVVYCSQNAMFILPKKMLKILYQLCTWSTSVRNAIYIMPVCVDAIKKLEVHILYLPFYSVHCFTSLNLLAKNIKCTVKLYSYRVNFATTGMHCITYCNSSGILQVVFLQRHVLESCYVQA